MLRELPPQDELNKPHDGDHIIVMRPTEYDCRYCGPDDDPMVMSIEWIEGPNKEKYGRCRWCGQKYCLLEG